MVLHLYSPCSRRCSCSTGGHGFMRCRFQQLFQKAVLSFHQKKCINDVIGDPYGNIGCPHSGTQRDCLCKSMNFWYGIRDCSQQACGNNVYNQVARWKDAMCAQPKVASTVSSAPSTGVTPAPEPNVYSYMEGGVMVTRSS